MFSFPSFRYTTFEMDKEQIVFLAGITVCVITIGAFIFWGPNPSPKRRGAVIGLQNLGLTCFLNTLLQALASCAQFFEWLESCKDQGPVASSLYYVLKVLGSEKSKLPVSVEDPLAPSCVIAALRQHGWTLGVGEQDAHELFHLLMVTLEEEAHRANMAEVGLPEVLEPMPKGGVTSSNHILPNSVESSDSELHNVNDNHLMPCQNQPAGDSESESKSLPPTLRLINKQGDLITRSFFPKTDNNRNYQASPFCGLLTSQLQCVKCGFKSVVRYDKFDSLSLHLPEKKSHHTLDQLLKCFTKPEAVSGVACDGCNKQNNSASPTVTATSLKTLTIGKLPKCLCIHIHRMSMGPHGSPYKRSDFVNFPEYLVMDPYTHNTVLKEKKLKEENHESENFGSLVFNSLPNESTGNPNHVYRIKAVVVHCGSVDAGHFVTYRRGPFNTKTRLRCDRWYFTSDETVREASLREALEATAYILFYEKSNEVFTN